MRRGSLAPGLQQNLLGQKGMLYVGGSEGRDSGMERESG
jgi:hypothetical protein